MCYLSPAILFPAMEYSFLATTYSAMSLARQASRMQSRSFRTTHTIFLCRHYNRRFFGNILGFSTRRPTPPFTAPDTHTSHHHPRPPRLRRRLRSRSSNGVPMLALAQNTSAYMWRDPQRAHPRQGLRYVACAARYAQQEHCCAERGVVWRERGIGAMGWMGRRGTGGCITLVVLSEKERLSRVAKWDAWMGPRESGRTPVHSRRQVGTLYVQHVCHLQIYTLLTNTQPSYEFITYL